MSRRFLSFLLTGFLLSSFSPGAFGFPQINNPGFEELGTWPGVGYGPIPGWTGGSGVNPSSDNQSPFADNGKIPEGTHTAFIQGGNEAGAVTLSQRIDGFKAGKTYYVLYNVNARQNFGFAPPPSPVPDYSPIANQTITPIT